MNTIFHLRDHDRVLPHVRDLVAPGGRAVLVDIVRPGSGREHSALRHRWFGVGDAARVTRAGAARLTAPGGAEVLAWEMRAGLPVG